MNNTRYRWKARTILLLVTSLSFLILVALAGCTSATPDPVSTHTSVALTVPAATPIPTQIPESILTSNPTPTPEPTATPTSMPTLSPTPEPTATPTSMPTLSPTPEPTIGPIECDDEHLTDEIIGLSEERESSFSPRILKLYSDVLEEVERTTRGLRCKAEAKLSAGGDFYITYYYEVDRDGDAFVGYSIGDPVPAPGSVLDDAFPVGEVMKGADGAEIQVLQITADAWPLVLAENRFNDPPEEGIRFFMVRVEVTNPSNALQPIEVSDSDFELIGDNRVIYTWSDDCGLIPDELNREIFPGGREEGNVCFGIPDTEEGLILIYKPGYGEENRRFLRITEERGITALVFSDLNWTSVQVQNRIAQYIVENGYGYETDAILGGTLPNFQDLLKGDIHITMEIWIPNQSDTYLPAIEAGQVVEIGESLGKDWQSNFVIPKFVADQYPGLRTVDDLKNPEYNQLFQNMDSGGKARLVGCPVQWSCERVAHKQVESYGLTEFVDVVTPGDQGELFADLWGNYSRQEPWIGYTWGTSDPALVLDLVRLEEPTYTQECWETTKSCGYQDATILIAVHPFVTENAPDVAEFLGNWGFNVALYKSVARHIAANAGIDNREAAIWWLKGNVDIWSTWVPVHVADKVRQALANY